MWKTRPNFSHLYSPKISHVRYPTECIKREEFDRIRHRCEQLDLTRHSYDIFDRIHHMWKIRPNFSHLYPPIMSRVISSTDYTKREKFNDILHICDKNLSNSYKMWHIGQNTSYVKKSDRICHTYIAENIKCKIFDLIGQTWGIRSNNSQMWRVWPNSTKLSHIQQNALLVKNPTEFLTPIFTDNVTCKVFDQTWEIQWYTTRMWKNRPNSYKLWHIGQKTSHEKNATEFLTTLFTENVSPVWHLTKYSTGEQFYRIFRSCEKFSPNSSQSWYIWQNTSHVKNPTEFLTPIFAENITCKMSN